MEPSINGIVGAGCQSLQEAANAIANLVMLLNIKRHVCDRHDYDHVSQAY
jgi:hypothetical protein